ncbi:MAG: EAL domain-containing protein [Solirubrobacteraceae bacterium]|nr:EAL domain-containing protein [Solirubrobacteraceae bacterium]
MRADSFNSTRRGRRAASLLSGARVARAGSRQRSSDQALSAADQAASVVDQLSSDSDHAAALEGRRASRLEQQRADLEQRASDADQEAADCDVRAGAPQTGVQKAASRRSRLLRRGATADRVSAASGRVAAAARRASNDEARGQTSIDRDSSGARRDAVADDRDELASEVDRRLLVGPEGLGERQDRALERASVAAGREDAARDRRDAAGARARQCIHEAYLAIEDAREAERELDGQQSVDDERLDEVRRALPGVVDRGELSLNFQPLYDLGEDCITGFEALVRWTSPELGFIGPDDFIPLAEESGEIVPIGDWVLREAVAQLATWRGLLPGRNLTMAVNVAPEQMLVTSFVDRVGEILERAGVPAHALTLEITERTLVRDAPALRCAMERLRQHGVLLSVDDFGTGFSSLGRLSTFPLDELKIDRIFVAGLGDDPRQRGLVAGIISMSAALDLDVVAEGIETDQQREILAGLGCHKGQGYLMSRPLSAEAIVPLLLPLHTVLSAAA